MRMKELLEDKNVQKIINEKLAAGEKIEVICTTTGERKVFGEGKVWCEFLKHKLID